MILIGDVKEPRRSTKGSGGYDFFAPDTYELKPNEWTLIDTKVGIRGRVTIKVRQKLFWKFYRTKEYTLDQWFMLVAPRSGLSSRFGMKIRTTVGIIDQDYPDTVKLLVTVDEPYTLLKGERMAQGMILPFGTYKGEIEPTEARTGGHGSTGRF